MYLAIGVVSAVSFFLLGSVIGSSIACSIWTQKAKSGFWLEYKGKKYRVTDMTDKDPIKEWRRL